MQISSDTWAIVLSTIAAAILGAFATWLSSRPASVRNDAYDKVTGSIEDPKPNQKVGKTFHCSGVVTGLQAGLGLWLAVEKDTRIWPKENRPVPGPDNKWDVTLFEDGPPEQFSVALYLADRHASKRVQKWLQEGAKTRSFIEMKNLHGLRRLARVDGVSIP